MLLKAFLLGTIRYDVSQCLKITEKVAFNIVSEASYFYILSGQKFQFKNAKKNQMKHFEQFSNSVF